MTKLEEVARAIAAARECDPDRDFVGKPIWQHFVGEARAAVAAMRVPNETMLKAAGAFKGDCPVCNYGGFYGHPGSHKLVMQVYTKMLDAIA